MRTEKEISEGATVQKKMTVERIKEIRELFEPNNFYLVERTIDVKFSGIVNLIDTAIALYKERDEWEGIKKEANEYILQKKNILAENSRLSRYERAWKQINELATPDEVVLLFLAYSLDKIEKQCGIEEDK